MRNAIYIVIFLLTVSCEYMPTIKEKISETPPIARVNDIFLFKEDVQDLFKSNVSEQDSILIIKNYIDQNPKIDFIFGSVIKHWGVLHGYRPEKIKYSWGFYSSHSTGFFIKRKVAEKVGFYNIKYKYHADYDYFYRLIVKNEMKGTSTKKNEIVGIFRRGGFSSKISFWKKLKEDIRIRYDNGQNIFLLILIFSNKFLRNIDQILKNIITK